MTRTTSDRISDFTRNPESPEDPTHPMVLTERVREKPCDALRSRSLDELLEKLGAGAIALPLVGDDERDLCVARARQAVEPADADDVATVDGHHRLAVVMVDVSEVLDL